MKEVTQLDIMNELTQLGMEVLMEVLEEEVKPLVEYRKELEKKIGNKEINEMLKLEQEAK